MNTQQIQAMINASTLTLRTELKTIRTELNKKIDEQSENIRRQSRIIYGLETKMDKKLKSLEEKRVKETRELRGEIVELKAMIFHRHNLAHITPTDNQGYKQFNENTWKPDDLL
jgi:hypothetical protein